MPGLVKEGSAPHFRVQILVVERGLSVAQAGLKSVIPVPQPPLHGFATSHLAPECSRYTES